GSPAAGFSMTIRELPGGRRLDFEMVLAPGRPLDRRARRHLERRFGHDFRRVRIHTGPQAAWAAELLGARAFTAGRTIVSGAGQYAADTERGMGLPGHEWTQVVQQARERHDRLLEEGALEEEAELIAARLFMSRPLPTISQGAAGVVRRATIDTASVKIAP